MIPKSIQSTQSDTNLTRRSALPTFLAASIVILTALATLPACRTNTAPNPGQLDPALPYYRIMTNDDQLARALRFDKPTIVRDENGFITKVEVVVRAASAEPLRVDYRPIFKDANNTVLQPESSWRTKLLEKRVPERIVMLPNAKNASDYEIQFRWAR